MNRDSPFAQLSVCIVNSEKIGPGSIAAELETADDGQSALAPAWDVGESEKGSESEDFFRLPMCSSPYGVCPRKFRQGREMRGKKYMKRPGLWSFDGPFLSNVVGFLDFSLEVKMDFKFKWAYGLKWCQLA